MDQQAEQDRTRLVLKIGSVILLVAIAFGAYSYWKLSADLSSTRQTLEAEVATLEGEKADLEEQLALREEDNEELLSLLEEKQREIDEFDDRLEEVTEGLGILETTIETDPELLRKYSRVFFLSENYRPSPLREIDTDYTYNGESHYIHGEVEPYLEDMIEDAEDDGFDLRVASAYRSFEEQNDLNNHYSVVYGAGTANQFSAAQGYSEHQLGTTVDFTTPDTNGNIDIFGTTEAFEWLVDNAHEYGFVLSYPEGNSYYQYEPWHWRFVGVDLAEDLEDEGAHFYDWDQRKINGYRAKLFD